MSSKPTDQLPAAIEHLRAWTSAQRIAWVPGALMGDLGEFPRVRFDSGEAAQQALASAQAFTRTLAELDVAMLVVSIVTLDEESQSAAVALFEESEMPSGPTGEEMRTMTRAMLSEARAARKHIGEPGSVLISAITRNPTVAIDWSETADWYMVIEAADIAYESMEDVDVGPHGEDGDYDEWGEIEPEPEPPVPPRRRIEPRR